MFFDKKARIPDLRSGYERYVGRCANTKKENILDYSTYRKIVDDYCGMLAQRLEQEGTIDLPCGIGSIVAVAMRRRPTYDKKANRWRSSQAVNWKATKREGTVVYHNTPNTFGFILSPRREKGYENFRCYGIRVNAKLYARMRKQYDDGMLPFHLNRKDMYV